MSAAAPQLSGEGAVRGPRPLEQLLHALNQPLTGLQCSMEVALASPRSVEYYAGRLREALELTERMRALVKAIREVVDAEGAAKATEIGAMESGAIEFQSVLREVLRDLGPVAEAKGVAITVEGSEVGSPEKMGKQSLVALIFRTLEAVLSLADLRSGLRVETGDVPDEKQKGRAMWWRMRWTATARGPEYSPPELGLTVAQAGWEHVGARWRRERIENLETVTVQWPHGGAEGT